MNRPVLSIYDYIKEKLNTTQQLPFETKIVHYKKNEFIKRKGDVEENIYFLVAGITEVGKYKRGENVIIEFFFSGEFFCDILSLITMKQSSGYVSCVTDCTIEMISYKALVKAYNEKSLIANEFGRRLAEISFIKRIMKESNSYKTAKERYSDLMLKRPEMVKNLPVSKIAKYLGINPNSLSRIRKSISDKS